MIKNISQMEQTFKTYDSKGWTNKIDSKEFGLDLDKLNGQESAPVSFGQMLSESLSRVNSLQQQANSSIEKLASGESQNLHDTLLTVEKAEIAFKTMNQVRHKVIDAYKEIMRMQI